jgi:membrane associated rhomboid family serine protease
MQEPLPLCTLAIIAFTAWWSWRGFRNPFFMERYLFSPAHILGEKEYYRLFTCGFLHADWFHLFMNGYSLYIFGRSIELECGVSSFLLIYFGSIVGGSLLSLYLHRRHDYRALGASGGVCGVIFASIFLFPGISIIIFPVPIPIPSWLYAVLFLIASFVGLKRQIGNIGHDAHLGGAIIGLLITTALYPSIVALKPGLYAAVMGLATVLFLYLWLHPLWRSSPGLLERLREGPSQRKARFEDSARESEAREMDRLLEKIARSGLDSLSPQERRQLDRLAEERRKRGLR